MMSEQLKEEGLALFRRGMHDEALSKFEAAAHAYAEAGDEMGRAEALNNVGVVQRVRQEWDAAEEALKEAIELFALAGDDNRQGQALGNLGDFYAFRGDAEKAADYYGDGAELLARSGDVERQAQVLRTLSLLRLRQRRIVEAITHMEQSLEIRPRLNPLQRIFLALIHTARRLMGGSS